MPRKVTLGELQEAVNTSAKFDNLTEAARFLRIPRSTLQSRLSIALRQNIEPQSDVDPILLKSLDLQRQNVHLRDRLSSLESTMKHHMRIQELFDDLCDEMQRVVRPIEPLPKVPMSLDDRNVEHTESLVLHLSDEHADQIVEPHRVGGLETYNLSVALARAEHLVQKMLSISQTTLSNYRFNELWILAYGDHVNGEIHDATNHSEYRNAFDNAIAAGQMHALMIRDIAPFFPVVKVLYLPGNHGRRSNKKDYHSPKDNWDYLVGRTAEMMCADIDNVEFLIPDSFSYTFEINGWNFCAFHGDDIKSWNSIPHYGIERKSRRLTAVHSAQGRQIHYFVMGHFHSRSQMEHPGGEALINGTWKATDEFAYESLGLVCKPSQLLHGVNKTHGVSFRFPIYLKFDGDVDGPKRYKAPLRMGHMGQIPKLKDIA